MVGRVVWRAQRGKCTAMAEELAGLRVYTATVYAPASLRPAALERRLRWVEREFRRAGVSRLLMPPGDPLAGRLAGLRPVDVCHFYRAVADRLTLGWLGAHGIPPGAARVALCGTRVSHALGQAAQRLCPLVREVRIDVPGEEGERLARRLQREYGLPILPPSVPSHVSVAFSPWPGRGALRLYGEELSLDGLSLRARGRTLPPAPEEQLLALLWEAGALRREELEVLHWGKIVLQ